MRFSSLFVNTLIVTFLATSSVSATGDVRVPATHTTTKVTFSEPVVKTEIKTEDELVREAIREEFDDPKEIRTLEAIAACESNGEPDAVIVHFEPDGSLLKNKEGASSAAGAFQVTLYGHRKAIKKLGLNMEDIGEYMKFVRHLKEEAGGYRPWKASKSCWKNFA